MQDERSGLEQSPVLVASGGTQLVAELDLPVMASGVIVLVHGLRSTWDRTRNRALAESFARAGLGTLACTFFNDDEEIVDRFTSHLRTDGRELAQRTTSVVGWLRRQKRFAGLPIGLFGTELGATASLISATTSPDIAAVVAHAGRGVLPRETMVNVGCPTLFTASATDSETIVANCRAVRQMSAPASMHVARRVDAAGAGGALREALELAEVASSWFSVHLTRRERIRSNASRLHTTS